MKKLLVLFLFISIFSFGQEMTDHEKSHINPNVSIERFVMLDELNSARQNPVTYGKNIGIDLSDFKPTTPLIEDKNLNFLASYYAKELLKMAPEFKHSDMPFYESILWNYDPCLSIQQFIVDKGVNNLGHRKHMLNANETKIGIGIAKRWEGQLYRTYVVILTD